MSISLFNLYIDQNITGIESRYLTSEKLTDGIKFFNLDLNAKYDPVNKIRVNIWDSIHYNFLQGILTENDYIEYVSFSQQQEHSLEKFIQLKKSFSLIELEKNKIIATIRNKNTFVVEDGVHRLALYFYFYNKYILEHKFIAPQSEYAIPSLNAKKVQKILAKTKGQYFFNNWGIPENFEVGYHSFEMFGVKLLGQRNNLMRIDQIEKNISLKGRNILDVGCATGGMLLHVSDIGYGFGLDFDSRSIQSANLILKEISKQNPEIARRYSFRVFDFDQNNLSLIPQIIIEKKIDLIFLLSMGSWVKRWKILYRVLGNSRKSIVLEVNNEEEGAEQVKLFLDMGYDIEEINIPKNEDNSGNQKRSTYLLTFRDINW